MRKRIEMRKKREEENTGRIRERLTRRVTDRSRIAIL